MSTSSPPAVLLGCQEPAIVHRPDDVRSLAAAQEANDLADQVGMNLDESQRFTLEVGMGERAGGKWAAFEMADIEPRQNGKGDTGQVRAAYGLFVMRTRLIIWTAHEFKTANEAFLRMVALIEANRDLRRQVARIRYANGEQGIELITGERMKYAARSGASGRGFAEADLVFYDESQHVQAEQVAASLPTMAANPNAQAWYMGSPGLSFSTQQTRLRKRALSGDGGRLGYVEHTAEVPHLDAKGRIVSDPIDVTDRRLWALANPAFNVRISEEYVESELDALGGDLFARERLGVWDPVPDDELREVKLPAEAWAATVTDDIPAMAAGEVVISFGVSKDGEWSSIAVSSGSIVDPYVEVIDHQRGTGWLPGRLVELVQRWEPITVGCNGAGFAAAQVGPILHAFREAGLSADLLDQLSAVRYKAACGGLYTDVVEGRLRRPGGQGPLDDAAADATERPLGDGWAWDARNATVPISPLEAVTVARALLPTEAPTYDVLASVL